ncbi:uncharacterized protein LOC144450470 isoform X2 [Glandiceps talaboti]
MPKRSRKQRRSDLNVRRRYSQAVNARRVEEETPEDRTCSNDTDIPRNQTERGKTKCSGNIGTSSLPQNEQKSGEDGTEVELLTCHVSNEAVVPQSMLWSSTMRQTSQIGLIKPVHTLYEEGEKSGHLPMNKFKVQILGDSSVGKTSLRKALMGDEFDPREGSTTGIETTTCEYHSVNESWLRIHNRRNEFEENISWYIAENIGRFTHTITWDHWRSNLFNVFLISFCFILTNDLTTSALITVILSIIFCLTSTLSYFLWRKYDFDLVAFFTFIVTICNITYCICVGEDYRLTLTSFEVIGFLIGMSFGLGYKYLLFTTMSTLFCFYTTYNIDVLHKRIHHVYRIMGVYPFVCMLVSAIIYKYWNPNMLNTNIQMSFMFIICIPYVYTLLPESHYVSFYALTLTIAVLFLIIGFKFGREYINIFGSTTPRKRFLFLVFLPNLEFLFFAFFPSKRMHLIIRFFGNLVFHLIQKGVEVVYLLKRVNLTAKVYHHLLVRLLKSEKRPLPVTLSLWDFAGQQFYYNTHHVFIASRAIYLIVFKLPNFKLCNNRDEQLKRLLFWLHSVCTHAMCSYPSIILVGTHRDSVSPDVREEIASYLKEKLFDTNAMYCNSLILNTDNTPLFSIENSITNENGTEILRQRVLSSLRENYDKDTYPIRWARFLPFLNINIQEYGKERKDKKKDKKKRVTTFEYAAEIAKDLVGIEDRDELTRMLRFFHQAGEVIYLDNDPVLRQFVILDPQLLVDVMKTIVNIPDERKRKEMSVYWNQLEMRGILHHILLKRLLKPFAPDAKVMVTLLQAYDLIYPLGKISKSTHGVSGFAEEYVIPSMRPVYTDDPATLGPITPDKVFYFDFGYFKPDSILSRLLAKGIGISQTSLVYRNVGRFTIDGEYSFRMELVENLPEQHLIKITIASTIGSNPFSLLRRLYNFVNAMANREFPNLVYKCGILCPFPSPHEGCENERMLHILELASHERDFPFATRKVTRQCNGVPHIIKLQGRLQYKMIHQFTMCTSFVPRETGTGWKMKSCVSFS